MVETWLLKTADGEEYNLRTTGSSNDRSYYGVYNLFKGVTGHHGMPVTINSDPIANIPGAETRNVQRGIRNVTLPLWIRGKNPGDFHRNLAKIRRSLRSEDEAQLWVINEEGHTRVLYCRYRSGFDSLPDDESRQLTWAKVMLVMEADDPYWYDPPGSELTRSFSSEPWGANFFTFSVTEGLEQDALIDDTRVHVINTENLVAGKIIKLHGSKVVIGSEMDYDETVEEEEVADNTEEMPTNLYAAAAKEEVAVNEPVTITGKLVDTNGKAIINQVIQVNTTYTPQTSSQSATITQIQNTGPITGSGNVINYGSQSITQINRQVQIVQSGTGSINADILSHIFDRGDGDYVVQGAVQQSVKNIVTDHRGNFILSDVFDWEGDYDFDFSWAGGRIGPDGDFSHLGPFHHGSSKHIKIKVGVKTATTLTLETSVANPAANTAFKLLGTLHAGAAPLANQKITLYKGRTTGEVSLGTTSTNADGQYSFTLTEATDGWFAYRASFGGVTVPDTINWSWMDLFNKKMFDFYEELYARMYKLTHAKTYLKNPFAGKYPGSTTASAYGESDAKFTLKIGTPTYPINYHVALTPNQVNDGEIEYFGYKGFNTVVLIAEKIEDVYHAERLTITAQGFTAIIDISVVTDEVPALSESTIRTWLQSLSAEGWTICSGFNSTGRTDDPAYLTTTCNFAKYVNYNSAPRGTGTTQPDISGTGVDHNSFECLSPNAVPWIETFTEAAYGATVSVKSGLLAPVINNISINPMLFTSLLKTSPTYRDLYDWSYEHFVGMTNFLVWFHPKYNAKTARDIRPEQLSLYKNLGFDKLLTYMQVSYPLIPIAGGWIEPTAKATTLTIDYTLNPLVFTGVLTLLKNDEVVPDATVNLQIQPYSLLSVLEKVSEDSPALGQADILFSDTSGFVAGGAVIITDGTHTETTHTISTVTTDTKITLNSVLVYDYVTPSVTQTTWPVGHPYIYVNQITDFVPGDVVTIADGTNTETRTITSMSGKEILFSTNLAHTYGANATATGAWKNILSDTTDDDGVYSISVGKVTRSSAWNAASGQKDILFSDTSGFVPGSGVTITDATTNTETGRIASVTLNTKITLIDNLTYSYVAPTVVARTPVGEHLFRASYPGDAGHKAFIAPFDSGIQILHMVNYETVAVSETNHIDSVDSNTVITVTDPLSNDYLVANHAYLTALDETDTFLNPTDLTTRTVNDEVEFIVFWMRQCPPCYTLKKQIVAINQAFTNTAITWVEIHDNHSDPVTHIVPDRYDGTALVAAHSAIDERGNLNIGMDDAAARYPMGYNFANTCGPNLPAKYHALGTIMPAVLCVYRNDFFIKGWCGVHTTGIDPVSTETIEDACGPRMTWRLGQSSIGSRAIIINRGDDTAYPVWTVTGPGRSPTLTNITTGDTFSVAHDLVTGEAVIIDTQQFAHTCASTRATDYKGAGYMKSEVCPTCQGKGVIPAACETCGGAQICPTCHGAGKVSLWVPSSSGSSSDIGGLYNLRYAMTSRNYWGFKPGANVIKVEMGVAQYGASIANMKLIQRYEGI